MQNIQENFKWTGAVIYTWRFTVSFPSGASVKECTIRLWEPEGRVHCEGNSVWTCWPGPLWKTSSSSEALDENELLDACPRDIGRSVCRCDTPASLKILPRPQRNCRLGLLLLHFHSPKPVQIIGLGTGAWLSYLEHSWQTADWETNIQSGLSRCWNKWSRSEMPYYFSCFVAWFFTDQCIVYFNIQN